MFLQMYINTITFITFFCIVILNISFYEHSNILNYKINTHKNKIKNCTWNNLPHLYEYSTKYIEYYDYIIKILEKLNVIYYIQYGSLLGAIRNGGLIPNDHDMDLAIPIWKNYHIFLCKEYVNINCQKYNMNNCFLYNKYKLCGHNRTFYVNVFKKYMMKYISGYSIHTIKRSVVITNSRIRIDLTIYFGNEGSNNNINLCKTTFSGINVVAIESAFVYSYLDYGKYFLDVNNRETMPRLYLYDISGPIYSYEIYTKLKDNKTIIIETKNLTKAKMLAHQSFTWRIWCKIYSKPILC